MRKAFGFLLLIVAAPSFAAAPIESLRSDADAQFLRLEQLNQPPADQKVPAIPQAGPVQEPLVVKPGYFRPLWGTRSAPLASFSLAEKLDAHRSLLPLQLGAGMWNVSFAADSAMQNGYFTFQRKDALLIKLMDFDQLRGGGSTYKLDENTAYCFKAEISLLNPVYASELRMTPALGTQGARYGIKTGAILDALRKQAVGFQLGGKDYMVLYGTDVDPATGQLAKTRSLLFIHEAGLGSKTWPVPESKLQADQPLGVALGDARVALSKGSDGVLRIYSQ